MKKLSIVLMLALSACGETVLPCGTAGRCQVQDSTITDTTVVTDNAITRDNAVLTDNAILADTSTTDSARTDAATGDSSTATVTWTQVHALLMASCSGGSCHSSSFASPDRAAAFTAVSTRVVAMNAVASPVWQRTATDANGGRMPQGRAAGTPWPGASNLAMWINAGALNN